MGFITILVCWISGWFRPWGRRAAPGLLLMLTLTAAQVPAGGGGAKGFQVQHPDFKRSPYTGMTRQHWKDAALYLLTGAFSYVHGPDDPLVFPKQPGRSYPRSAGQVPTEKLEGLCRTLFVAMPLLKENPALEINGVRVGDYYRRQLGRLLDPASPTYIRPRPKTEGESQTLVEFGGLAVSLFAAPEILWDPLPQAQKDVLAATMLSYGDGPTVPSNWRFFNIFVLSFFKSRGYAVNEPLLDEYLRLTLAAYRGNGWYSDNGAYDYYSMWAFQLYGTLWSEFYGRQHAPEYARQYAAHLADCRDNYPYLFGRTGEMVMWGRSISYRFGAVAPFPLMGLVPDPAANYGWLRRIASGAMLQFLQNPDFLQNRVPTLGLYGPFEPAVQAYSCRGSVFWMGKAFLGLLVPASSPFWTATENEGPWATPALAPGTVANRFQAGSNILITDYSNSGAAEIRARCATRVAGVADPYRGNENYNRLSYNSAFPWQADGPHGEVAMNYVFQTKDDQWHAPGLYTFRRFEDGIYYRDAVLEADSAVRLRLADVPLPNGILRVDEVAGPPGTPLRLGHYALPALRGPVRRRARQVKGHPVQLLDNGAYQLALVPLSGWAATQVCDAQGLHPVSHTSTVINATGTLPTRSGPTLYATLLLWKKSGTPWTDNELLPVTGLTDAEPDHGIWIRFADGRRQLVHFN